MFNFLTRAWRRDLLIRLYVGVFLIVAFSTGLYTVYALKTLQNDSEEHLQERIERLSTVISETLARPLFDYNSAAVLSAVNALSVMENVVSVLVFDAEGKLVAGRGISESLPSEVITQKKSIAYVDGAHNTDVGSLELALSRKEIDTELRQQIGETAFVLLLITMAIIGGIYQLSRTVVRPFRDIQKALDTLANGEVNISLSGAEREDQIGLLSQAVLSFRDSITERKRIEAALQQSHSLLTNLADNVPGVLYQIQRYPDGLMCIPFASEGCKEMWELSPEALRADASSSFLRIHPDDREKFAASVEESARTLLPWHLEFRVLLPKQGLRWRLGDARPESLGDGSILWHGFITDITSQKQAETKLQELNEGLESKVQQRTGELALAKDLAESASRAKGDFLANMSHEIRTPMNAVLGMSRLALNTNPPPRLRDYLEKIYRSGDHLLGIINGILDFSKIEAGKFDLDISEFRLDSLTDNVRQLVEEKAKEKGLHLAFDVAPETPERFYGDALRLSQILVNYSNNAIKFTDTGTIHVRVGQVANKAADNACLLRFEVQDSGIGMTESEQSRLFQSFEQANASTSRKYGGTGLGLAISKQLAELMGGEVGVASEPGQGSTFWFTARLQTVEAFTQDKAHEQALSKDEIEAAIRGRKILLAEDNLFNQQVASEFLEEVGAIVVIANNGIEALNLLRNTHFDCVLMDVQMPEMDGLEATRQIRANANLSNMRILAMTANARKEDRDACLAAGMNDFVAKPIVPEKFFATLAKCLLTTPNPPFLQTSSHEIKQGTGGKKRGEKMDTCDPPGDLPIFDVNVLSKMVLGKPDRMRKFAGLFKESAHKGLSELDEALLREDLASIAALGHRLKSSARAIGALSFGALCQSLEQFKQVDDIHLARQIVARLHALLLHVEEQLALEVK